jgi:hypothetical protein
MEKPVFIPSVLVGQLNLTILEAEVREQMFWLTFAGKCVEDEYKKVLGEEDLGEQKSSTKTEAEEQQSLSDDAFIDAFVNLPPIPTEHMHYEKSLSLVTDKGGSTIGYVVTAIVKRREAELPLASAHLFHSNLLKAVEYFAFAASFLYPQKQAILDKILHRHRR